MGEEEAMCSPFVHLELAVGDRLRGPASTQFQGSALILIAMNDQRWDRTGSHIRSEVRFIRRPDDLKDGFGRGLKNEPDHPLNHRGRQDFGPWPCRSQTEVLDRAAVHILRTIHREY